jgi:hypothetical protein
MEFLESRVLNSVPDGYVVFWRRYVDDVFAIVHKDKVSDVLASLNSFHPKIQFTVEREVNGSLPFLDLLVTRERNGYLGYSVYRKPTHTGRYLHFASWQPFMHKRAVVRSLVGRAFTHSSTFAERKNELDRVKAELAQNGYPRRMVNRMICTVAKNVGSSGTAVGTLATAAKRKWCKIPFFGDAAYNVRRVMGRHGVHVAFAHEKNLGSLLTHVKDKTPILEQANLVYKIPCTSCNVFYVGETKRRLGERVREHQDAVSKLDAQKSALVDHVESEEHAPAWQDVSVLRKCCGDKERKWAEAIEIVKSRRMGILNRDDGCALSAIYKVIF